MTRAPGGWSFEPPPQLEEYRIVRPLGRGAMGQVYLAHDTFLDRPVAIKFIAALDPNPVARERFVVEARAAARLQHPNVVTVYRVGVHAQRPFLVSELVAGQSLDQMERPVPWQRALQIGLGLARGLAAAHGSGVLHRDIKPANAILSSTGEVKLLDFGLAKLVTSREAPDVPPQRDDTDAPDRTLPPTNVPDGPAGPDTIRAASDPSFDVDLAVAALTRAGALLGTPSYMAPEIWRGEPASSRSDLYSLGALLYEICSGRPPHRRPDLVSLCRAVIGERATPLLELAPSVEPRLAELVDRCLEREAGDRIASAEDLRDALARLLPRSAAQAVPEGNPYRGLGVFEAEHRGLFFGRDGEIAAITERLRYEPFVLVVGDSGVGKSSLCRAGVLPGMAEGALGEARTWTTVTVLPGPRPLVSLGEALAPHLGQDEQELVQQISGEHALLGHELRRRHGSHAGLVLFVDQLEELVTLAAPGEGRAAGELLGRLAMRTPGVRLLATARADFLGKLAELPALGDHLSRSIHVLRPLSEEGCRRAIEEPAAAKGVSFETEALVRSLSEAARVDGAGMPLLGFALAELWEARDRARHLITTRALESIGGVPGALARHADGVVTALAPAQRSLARRIFIRLVSAQGTRARKTETQLALGPEAALLLSTLVRDRLLVARESEDGTSFEISHEALLTGWGTLARWLDDLAGIRGVQERVATAASEWDRLGRRDDGLFSGRQLEEARALPLDDLPSRERAFVAASWRKARRTRALRRAFVLGVPLLLALGYVGHRAKVQWDLDDTIRTHLDEAATASAAAGSRSGEVERLTAAARARVEAMDRAGAEALFDQIATLGAEIERTHARAGAAIEAALALAPGRDEVRRSLVEHLYERARIAERERRPAARDELLRRLAAHDLEGTWTRRFDGERSVTFRAPAGAHIEVAPAASGGAEASLVAGADGVARARLAPGSYVASAALSGAPALVLPFNVERERDPTLVLGPPPVRVPDGFVYVPAGRFWFGSAEESLRLGFLNTIPITERETAPYLIARAELTFGEWLTYLRDLPPAERRKRAPRVSGSGLSGAIALSERADGFELRLQLPGRDGSHVVREGEPIVYSERSTGRRQDWRRFPVVGISWHDFEAYTHWLDSTGRLPGARPCDEREWERAARGSDDREFPHGRPLRPADANFDETHGKDGVGPDEVAAHPASRSPFGLDDMSGNAWEWTRSSLVAGEVLARGGAYPLRQVNARITNREVLDPALRDLSLGARVCASPRF